MNGGKRTLTPEEKAIWEKVKKTADPLHHTPVTLQKYLDNNQLSVGNSVPEKPMVPGIHENVRPDKKTIRPYSPEPASRSYISNPQNPLEVNRLEQKTVRRIARGKISIDGRVDLHGMTQLEAHDRLFRVLEAAWLAQKRTILVITGKGRGEGVLRQAVPRWLSEPSFRAMISGLGPAQPGHGGEGALYVRIKRRRDYP